MDKKRVCVYCASSSGLSSKYLQMAYEIGTLLAKKDFGLVYGGANVGLMNAVAEGALEKGGEVIGVLPQSILDNFEVKHERLTYFYETKTMHERKKKMYDLSDAFLAIPGGFGTLDEICEILTWKQIKIHDKACGLFNFDSYYSSFIDQINHIQNEGLMNGNYKDILSILDSKDDVENFLLEI